MKITKQQLQQIIKEELQTEMDYSQEGRDERFEDALTQSSYEEIIQLVGMLLRKDPQNEMLLRIDDLLSGGGY
tara:strand:- start:477 stop:695 length:219 start_codon:yes stop_codon:yes gene_type:complete